MTTPYQSPSTVDGPLPGGYTSPVPITPTGLGNALRSEWTKIRSVRSTLWTLGVLVLLVLGIGLLIAGVMHGSSHLGGGPALTPGFFGVLLGSLCVVSLGVLTITSEYGTGMIRTTLTAGPSRSRMLTAKALVFTTVAFTVTTACCAIVAVADNALLVQGGGVNASASPSCAAPGSPHPACAVAMTGMTAPTTDQWVRGILGIGLYVALLGLLSLAVGALLRHTAGAISLMMGVILLPLILALFMASDSLRHVRDGLIEYCVPNGMTTLYDNSFLETGPHGWDPVYILAAVTAVAVAAAYGVLNKRDV